MLKAPSTHGCWGRPTAGRAAETARSSSSRGGGLLDTYTGPDPSKDTSRWVACQPWCEDITNASVGPQLPPDAKAAIDAGRLEGIKIVAKEFAVGVVLAKGLGLAARAVAWARGLAAASEVMTSAEVIGVLRPGGSLIGEAGTKSSIRLIQGGAEEAQALFGRLTQGGEAVRGTTYPGTLVRLGDGGTIGFRPISTSGPPTIDVSVKGLGIREIKFIP